MTEPAGNADAPQPAKRAKGASRAPAKKASSSKAPRKAAKAAATARRARKPSSSVDIDATSAQASDGGATSFPRSPRTAAPVVASAPPAPPPPPPPATGFTVFLDRDGVFNAAPRILVWRWSGFKWLPGAPKAFARLNQPDIRTCLCTNQPFVGLGVLWPSRLARLHGKMMHELAVAGGRLHHIEVSKVPWGIPSRRRKPRPGMLEDGARHFAQSDWNVGTEAAVMIGDLPKDAQAAAAFGIPAILLATTHDRAYLEAKVAKLGLTETVIADDLTGAVALVQARVAQWRLRRGAA